MLIIFELLPLLGLFVLVLLLCLRCLYQHPLIQSYLPRDKLKINDQIQRINLKCGSDLPLLDQTIKVRVVETRPLHYSHKDKLVGAVFAFTLALLVVLVVLMMCELKGWFSESTRLAMFQFTIDGLIINLTVVIPWMLMLLLVNKDVVPLSWWRGFITVVSVGVWFIALHKCGDLTRLFNPRNHAYLTRSFLEKLINEISISGITTLAILSGIGTTLTPWRIWCDRWTLKPELTLTQLWHQIQAYNQTTKMLGQREAQLHALDDLTLLLLPLSPQKGGLLSRVQSFASLTGFGLEEKELAMEIKSLRNVQYALAGELQAQLYQFLATPTPTWIVTYRYALSAYCLYRLINVLVLQIPMQMWKGADRDQRDALAVTLGTIITSISPLMNQDRVITLLSFVLSALLFLASFNNVIITFTLFAKYVPMSSLMLTTAKNWFKHLAIAELVGIYVMATAMLIRTYLPRTLSHRISQILLLSGKANTLVQVAMEEVRFIDGWFDIVFSVGCAVTMVGLWVRRLVADDAYDEELLVETAKLM